MYFMKGIFMKAISTTWFAIWAMTGTGQPEPSFIALEIQYSKPRLERHQNFIAASVDTSMNCEKQIDSLEFKIQSINKRLKLLEKALSSEDSVSNRLLRIELEHLKEQIKWVTESSDKRIDDNHGLIKLLIGLIITSLISGIFFSLKNSKKTNPKSED